MAQSSRGMMHLQYAHATCTSILRDGKTFRAIAPMIQRHNARLTRRFGAAKRRKIGRCAADCYAILPFQLPDLYSYYSDPSEGG